MIKVVKLGFLFFAMILWVLAIVNYGAGKTAPAVYYGIGGLGFLLVYFSYNKRTR